MKKHIIFICNGNIHRSVIAAECLRSILKERGIDSKFLVDSYGLQGTKGTKMPRHKRLSEYPKEWNAAKPTLQRLNIDISKHNFNKISAGVIKRADIVIAMDNKVYSRANNFLTKQFPKYAGKIHRFSELTINHKVIKDPAGSGNEKVHKKVIEGIHSTIAKKYKDILEWAK
jgi:protein-tyrosine phosphatase